MALLNESNQGEVSRIMAKIIGIHDNPISSDTTVYDPTCGSASLLLRVGEEASNAGDVARAGEGSRQEVQCSSIETTENCGNMAWTCSSVAPLLAKQLLTCGSMEQNPKENMGVAPLINL